jgi:hypothetical protein
MRAGVVVNVQAPTTATVQCTTRACAIAVIQRISLRTDHSYLALCIETSSLRCSPLHCIALCTHNAGAVADLSLAAVCKARMTDS